jgi:glycosyltransferase involved in cell wall biosynthesis
VRIALVVVYYLPSAKSSAKLIHDLALELIKQGHEATVIAPDNSIPTETQVTTESGITVFRARTGQIEGANLLVRGWNEIRLSSALWKAGRKFFESHPCDLVVFYSPPIFFDGLVERLRALWKCPSYLVLRDIFPQWAVDANVLRKGLPYYYFKRREMAQYRAADVIGVQSPANLDYFRERALDTQFHLEVLHNWSDVSVPPVASTDYRKAWGLQGKVVFLYGGNIGVAQDLDNLVRLAESLRDDPRAVILLVGEGNQVERLRAIAAAKGLSNFQIRESLSQADYAGMVGQFDVGLISLHRDLKTHNVPGKLLSYLVVSLPILASVNPGNDMKGLIEEGKAGFVVENGDDATLTDRARRLLNDSTLRRELGTQGRKLLERVFSASSAAKQILSHLPSRH